MKRAIAIALCLIFVISASAKDELARSTWEVPTHDQVLSQIESWLAETTAGEEAVQQVRRLWGDPIADTQRLSALADCLAIVNSEAKALVDLCRSVRIDSELPPFEFLYSSQTLPFERHNLRLIYGRWLAQNQLYDETLEQIADLETESVVDPASLLFYQSVAYHRLLKKEECLLIVERLLENEELLPKRFSALAKLIRADIEPLEADSLDEISRLMDNITVRLGHGRAGTRVRKEEDDVVAKLDKMIKDLEDKAQQSKSSASSGGRAGDALNPSKPMEDSMPGGAKGPGNVDAKEIEKKAGWGDLPPKERQQALQQLGKDFPSHYRDVIVEYFRKLSREGSEP